MGIDNKLEQIKNLLLEKSSCKQKAFRSTKEVLSSIKKSASQIAQKLHAEVSVIDPHVEIKFYEVTEYEMHLKFSGDTLVFMMHTNIFDFPKDHYIHQTNYVKENHLRQFCGVIHIYNFLSDTIKYNREGDIGYLVGRIFVNLETHFFVEGNHPLSMLYPNFAEALFKEDCADNIISEAMHFCMNFDLMAPPIDTMSYISLEQKNYMSHSSGIPTGKMLGFRNQMDSNEDHNN